MAENQSIVALSFDAAVGNGPSAAQARDMHLKHVKKIAADANLREIELQLEAARNELHSSKPWRRYKTLQSRRKEAQKMAMRTDDVYMGAVSNGLTEFMPGAPLAEKLSELERATERQLQLTPGGENE